MGYLKAMFKKARQELEAKLRAEHAAALKLLAKENEAKLAGLVQGLEAQRHKISSLESSSSKLEEELSRRDKMDHFMRNELQPIRDELRLLRKDIDVVDDGLDVVATNTDKAIASAETQQAISVERFISSITKLEKQVEQLLTADIISGSDVTRLKERIDELEKINVGTYEGIYEQIKELVAHKEAVKKQEASPYGPIIKLSGRPQEQ